MSMTYVYILSVETDNEILGAYTTAARAKAARERYEEHDRNAGIERRYTVQEFMADYDY
jgi:hypothetical protein